MKIENKRGYLLVLLVLIGALFITACKKEIKEVDNGTDTQNPQTVETDNSQDQPDADPSGNNGEDPSQTKEPDTGTAIDIYGINEDSLESEPAHAVIQGEVDAKSIVQAVVDDYAAKSIVIGIYDVKQEDKKVIVSFEYGKAPLASVGSDVEETILNCISDSLMDNLDSCEAVIFRAEDENYESGHFAFGMDEVYASE
ncbi:MAG: hypothetical protein ACERKN_15810 [Velocimicrobium sp.]